MDAIVHYCEKEKIEIETVSRLISKSLKEKIQAEAINDIISSETNIYTNKSLENINGRLSKKIAEITRIT